MNSSDAAYLAALGSSAVFGIIQMVFWILYAALMVFLIICLWKVYDKAGYPGWACIVPFYGWWVLFEITCKKNLLWFILMFVPVANYVSLIVCYIGLAKSFGKGVGMVLMLIFLPVIALPMLAFGDAEYDPDLRFGEY